MSSKPVLIHVEPTSELAEALGEREVLLESKGVVYIAEHMAGTQPVIHDIEEARAAIRQLRGVDVKKLEKELREQQD